MSRGLEHDPVLLRGALAWLRDHYEVGASAERRVVLRVIDSVLGDAPAPSEDARVEREAFMDKYVKPLLVGVMRGR